MSTRSTLPPTKLTYNDSSHSYYLDGVRCMSATTVAKALDDTYNLDLWGLRQVLIGVSMKPSIGEAAAAHYDDRHKLNELADQAKAVAGSLDAAMRGTAAHRITELHDEGRFIVPTPLSTSVVPAWTAALEQAGLDYDPQWSERIVCYPDERVCGRFDRLMRRRSDGRLVVVDLKTGSRALNYPHSISVQLACYAGAPWVAGRLPEEGGSTTEFDPMPDDIDQTVGYVVHIPEQGQVQVGEINITAGAEALDIAFWVVRQWRKRDDLVLAIQTITVPDVEPVLVDPWAEAAPTVDVVAGDTTYVVTRAAAAEPTASLLQTRAAVIARDEAADPPADPVRVEWIGNRIRQMLQQPKEMLGASWPAGVPTVKEARESGVPLTSSQLQQIVDAVNRIDAHFAEPFPAADDPAATVAPGYKLAPFVPAPPRLVAVPNLVVVDEGGMADEDTLAGVRKQLADLTARDPEMALQLSVLATEGKQSGAPFAVGGTGNGTVRRCLLVLALIELANAVPFVDYRPALTAALDLMSGGNPTAIHPTLGGIVGRLNIDEALSLASIAGGIGKGLAMHVQLDGSISLQPV